MHVRALVEVVAITGIEGDRVLSHAGFDAERLSDPYGWFTVEEFDQLMLSALALTGEAALGLHWVEASPLLQFDLVAPLVAQSESLRAAIQTMLRFQPIMTERPELTFVDRGGSALLRCAPSFVSEAGLRMRSEMMTVGMVRLLRHLGGPSGCDIRRVSFVFPRPSYGVEYDREFGATVHFEQSYTGVDFDYVALEAPLPRRNPELHGVLAAQAERLLSRVLDAQTYREQLKRLLRNLQPLVPEMPDAARTLGMSERSLRRRLADEGVSYSQVVEESQIELARAMLGEPSRSIKEVAHELGFTSASGFHRAFKRWTGTSPALFRARR
jgi:AraC-like DNA-binding protein